MQNKKILQGFPSQGFVRKLTFCTVFLGHIVLFANWNSNHKTVTNIQNKYLFVLNIPLAPVLPANSPKEQIKSTVPTPPFQKANKWRVNTNSTPPVSSNNVAKQEMAINHPLETVTSEKSLDLEGLRRQALIDEKQRSRSPFEKAQEQERIRPGLEAKFGDDVKVAAQKDCQSAYSKGGNLRGGFALLPLIYGSLTDKCKWK
ncbi:hypothetical protein ACO0K9_20265 [Undibacterium sp. Ji50W]|uniref:hypothetical protein n=1 Tax=Undibacterium sp. Ji50W TaxID=3413041 RepID=UPI003BF35974